jgi:predicted Zn-dependent protease
VNDAWRLFERDMADSDLADIFIYVSTHPDSGDRVEDLRRQAEREGWPVSGEVSPLPW